MRDMPPPGPIFESSIGNTIENIFPVIPGIYGSDIPRENYEAGESSERTLLQTLDDHVSEQCCMPDCFSERHTEHSVSENTYLERMQETLRKLYTNFFPTPSEGSRHDIAIEERPADIIEGTPADSDDLELSIEYFPIRERNASEVELYPEAKCYEQLTTIELNEGEVAIFGYGSLLSKESLKKTLGKSPYEGLCVPCKINGWHRTFDVVMPNRSDVGFVGKWEENPSLEQTDFSDEGELVPENIAYFNVREKEGGFVNGMLYVVTDEQLQDFDKREWIYDRVEITELLRDQGVNIVGGKAYMYAGKEDCIKDPKDVTIKQVGLRRDYLSIITKYGLDRLGKKFVQDFILSTDPVPDHLLFHASKRGGGDGAPKQADIDEAVGVEVGLKA